MHMKTVKQLKPTDPSLKEQIKEFDKALSQSGQMKNARMQARQGKGGFRQPGGKRRRPKMR